MKQLFADTGYWIGLLNHRDHLHSRALEVSKAHQPFRTVTSEWVLVELLAAFAERGPSFRQLAGRTAQAMRDDPNMEIVPATSLGFREALDLYEKRPDKGWSLTDCASICIMKERGISEVLAEDAHFVQAGFEALLR